MELDGYGVLFDDMIPYSREVIDNGGLGYLRVVFGYTYDAVVVDHLPVWYMRIINSPNLTFQRGEYGQTFMVKTVTISGPGMAAFNDEPFRLQSLSISDVYLAPNQLTLRTTPDLFLSYVDLRLESLSDADVINIRFDQCIMEDLPGFIIPRLLGRVQTITVRYTVGGIHFTNIPDSLQSITVPKGELSAEALEMIHTHTQRLRYIYGRSSLRVIEMDFAGNAIEMDFTLENFNRDEVATQVEERLKRYLPSPLNNQIMQDAYGTHYEKPRFGGARSRSRARSRARPRGKSKSKRKRKRKKAIKSKRNTKTKTKRR